MTKRRFSILLIVFLLIALLPGCTPKTESINWTLYGTWVKEDGTVEKEQISVTVSGKLPLSFHDGEPQITELSVAFPEDFPFRSTGQKSFAVYDLLYTNDKVQQTLWCSGGTFHPAENRFTPMGFYIFDRECVVFDFYDAPGQYLIATFDQNADVREWLDIFLDVFPS